MFLKNQVFIGQSDNKYNDFVQIEFSWDQVSGYFIFFV
jgi:hypothetical protein